MLYEDWLTPTDQESQFIPWLMKKLAGGADPNFYKQQVAPQVAPTAPSATTATPAAAPALRRDAEAVDAVALPPLAQAMNVPAPPAAGLPYEGPDAPFNPNATPMAQAMGQQPGILQQVVGNPYASNLLTQMGAGLLRGKDLKEGLANAFDASSAVAQKAQAIKRTPLTGNAAGLILEEYPDGTMKTVSAADSINKLNKPGKDYIWDKAKNDWVLDPNSKTARDIAKSDAANKLQNRAALDEADNALRTIDQLEQQMKGGKVLGVDTTTGLLGATAGMVPGTSAYDVRETVKTIQGAFGIGKLQEMKRATPTGASGFGQLAVKELELLMALVTNLNPNQKPETVNANIAKAKEHFTRYRGYVEQAIAAGDGLPNQPASNAPAAAPTGGSVQDRASGYLR